ncbi:GMC family oxidoreductase N-terminal domain-containing protein [Alcanivorax sp. JB21]|uniref:GMC oxidoreductase n=1 Tax=Alcanivorax limicola TaxID=2874102 RepID=UPI001CC03D77|nr:GMC oxidoreductase [Alcanivorax limicola]MBZ2187789.1 GMC family oxidoreductase N-terminal domain-containing protein [Alcanivorax limicola]
MERTDTLVVGSGFGGAVMALRLAQQGARVLVLERGRRWSPQSYPSVSGRHWRWDERRPERHNGWIDFRAFGDMSVAAGAGVGGGSLIYANISIPARPDNFLRGWPAAISYAALAPHFATVQQMLKVAPLPANQFTPRTRLLRDAAEAIGEGKRFTVLPQAVTFDPAWHTRRERPYDYRHSRTWTNEHGRVQGTCVHCGNCDIGCPVQAKNTLDLNYLAEAEQCGAEIRPLHHVRWLRPAEEGGYEVGVRDLAAGKDVRILARRVVIAAGSIGSTELLLRCRDQYQTLPGLSDRLGHGWLSNGDFLTPARYPHRDISPSRGPTISAAIDFLDGSQQGQRFLVEDGGFPDVVGNLLRRRKRRLLTDPFAGLGKHRLIGILRHLISKRDPLTGLMPWFGQAQDEAGGVLSLGRPWYAPWRRNQLRMKWDYRAAEPAVEALSSMHVRLSEATGGQPLVPATWRWFRNLVTPHPLGGCNMADSPEQGVVDHRGEVFGYPELFVMDGAVVPVALGLNPSQTIAALAEYAAAQIAER